MLRVFTTILFWIISLNAYATFIFDRGEHAFKFTDDMSVFIVLGDNVELDGFGYYLNSDSRFYAITENDIARALEFSAGDTVRFVKQKGPAELKMTLWKKGEEYYDNVYKIGGAKNGIELQLKPTQYTLSGQPLPGTKFTLFTALLLVIAMLVYKFFTKRRSQI